MSMQSSIEAALTSEVKDDAMESCGPNETTLCWAIIHIALSSDHSIGSARTMKPGY